MVFACELSSILRREPEGCVHRFRARDDAKAQGRFATLTAMLVAERAVIKFLLGPSLLSDRKPKNGICVDCFRRSWLDAVAPSSASDKTDVPDRIMGGSEQYEETAAHFDQLVGSLVEILRPVCAA